jgi:hypothetical protein
MKRIVQIILVLVCMTAAGYGLYAIHHSEKVLEKNQPLFVVILIAVMILAGSAVVIITTPELKEKVQSKPSEQ